MEGMSRPVDSLPNMSVRVKSEKKVVIVGVKF